MIKIYVAMTENREANIEIRLDPTVRKFLDNFVLPYTFDLMSGELTNSEDAIHPSVRKHLTQPWITGIVNMSTHFNTYVIEKRHRYLRSQYITASIVHLPVNPLVFSSCPTVGLIAMYKEPMQVQVDHANAAIEFVRMLENEFNNFFINVSKMWALSINVKVKEL